MISGQKKRLDSWKEVAEYLVRDLRTVQRWESEKGLPIHRVPGGKRQAVFAYRDEIDAWLVSQSEAGSPASELPKPREIGDSVAQLPNRDSPLLDLRVLVMPQPAVVTAPSTAGPTPAGSTTLRHPAVRWWVVAGVGAGIAALAIAATLGFWLRRPLAEPKVVDYVQISEEIQVGNGIAADRSRLYFSFGENGGIREVSTAAGRAVSIPLPVHEMEITNLCAPRSELLLVSQGLTEDRPLWLFPIPGGPARRLGNVMGRGAACSPDGETIAYAQGHSLYVTDREGARSRELVTLPGPPQAPRWSPDGRVLRFSLQDNQTSRSVLWEVAANGANPHPLLPGWHGCSGDQYRGSWTADGRFYVFDCADRSEANASAGIAGSNLWVRREGSAFWHPSSRWPVRLTFSPISLHSPVFSADGKKIFALGAALRAEIARYDPGSGQLVPYLPGVAGDMLDFSRQSNSIAYVGYPYQELWRSRTDGSDRVQLASPPALYPRWSPDGRSIAYSALTGRRWKIHLIAAAGGTPEELVPGDSNQSHPTWSPDGGTLAFAGAPWEEFFAPESTAVHLFHLKTRQVETLPGSQGFWSPRWSPDGRYLAAITVDSRQVLAFDFTARKWLDLARLNADYTAWSHDGRYLYVSTVPSPEGSTGVYRVTMRTGKLERVLALPGARLTGTLGHWFGLAQDDSLLFLQDRSVSAVYALDWQAP